MTWTLEDSKLIYGVQRNDMHFLDINEEGKLELVFNEKRITFDEIVSTFIKKTKFDDVSFALRIPQLIIEQVNKLLLSFKDARIKYNYTGKYIPIYPIKVNHSKFIIETIITSNPNYNFESGTKSEFILLQQALKKEKHRLIMCNGAKDREFLKSIKSAIEKGYNICLSIETIQEMKDTLDILPRENYQLAFRIKPYVTLHGHWGASSGRNSKFGLSIGELMDVVKILKQENATHLLTTLHAHPGSQITSLEDFKAYAEFMAGFFTDLFNMGMTELKNLNFGGGLPIDYDNRLDPDFMGKYAETLIQTIANLLPEFQPNIMTESGRAITSLSTIVVVKTIEKYSVFPNKGEPQINELVDLKEKAEVLLEVNSSSEVIKNWKLWESTKPFLKSLNLLYEFEALTYWLKKKLREKFFFFEDYLKLIEKDEVIYFLKPEHALQGNFSIFNSVCDMVLVKQYFPVLPISDLHVQPESIVRLFDITCDSDGEIAVYNPPISKEKLFTKDFYLLTYPKPYTLGGFPVGKMDSFNDNYLVIPLTGAYQDIIEFDHNLLGDLPDVLIACSEEDWVIQLMQGPQSIGKLLLDVGFEIIDDTSPYFEKGACKNP
ncbi:MAG: hypothetical protein JXA54_02700 [Candidatus Heimdallarchaeota archaeon]|nr:hypothetical protein [Candidatus Heimdallarchaeota archaeon]